MTKSILDLTICCLLIVGLTACSSKKENEENTRIIPVKIQEIKIGGENQKKEYIGVVEGERSVDVSFLTGGNIEQIYFQEGQTVSKGQLLARLNTTSLQSMYNISSSTLSQAQDAYDRLTILYENKSLPEIKFIEAKTALDQAKAAEQIAKKNLSDTNLYAPFSGVIAKRYLNLGANVAPGTPIYNVVAIETVQIKIAIPEGEISNMKIGQPCSTLISALGNKTFEGQIVEKGISAHPISHTYDVKVKIINTNHEIMPGMVSKAYFSNTSTDKKVNSNISVPIKSIQMDSNGKHFVWLKSDDNKAIIKEVVLGDLTGNDVLIREGLKEGDQLIIEGYQHISPNSIVSSK